MAAQIRYGTFKEIVIYAAVAVVVVVVATIFCHYCQDSLSLRNLEEISVPAYDERIGQHRAMIYPQRYSITSDSIVYHAE